MDYQVQNVSSKVVRIIRVIYLLLIEIHGK